MLYLRAQELSQIQDAFNPNPLQDEKAIEKFYQDTTEARTGDAYSGFVEKMDLLLLDSHESLIHKLFIGIEKIERYWNSNTEVTKTISIQGEKMKKMKKLLGLLLLGMGICLAGMQTEVLASQRVPEKKNVQEAYVDLSDEIIQEGGFLKETDNSEKRAGASERAADTRRQVQSELTAVWDSFADSCNLWAYQITVEELKEIYAETLNGSSGYFYVSGGFSYSYSNGYVIEVYVSYILEDKEQLRQMQSTYDRIVAGVVSKADPSWSDMEKALYINDYLARNCEYDTTLENYTAYDALVERTAVCQGYALAFMDLARELGLSCEMVTSSALNHAWDMVKIGDHYYHVDVTWNDPLEDRLGRARHWYFMKSAPFFQSGEGRHMQNEKGEPLEYDWVAAGGIDGNDATDRTYDSYFWNGSDTGFDYLDGYWYGFDGQEGKYSLSKYTCNGTDFTETEAIKTIDDVWPVVGDSGYWRGKYVGTAVFDGRFYYSGKDSIYEWDPATGKAVSVFSLTEDQKKTGYLYGMYIQSSGELQYILASSPNEQGTVYTAQTLTQTPKSDHYRIYFQGNGAGSGSMEPSDWIESGTEFQLPPNQFQKSNFTFSGWNTARDGNGESYQDQAAISRKAAYDGEKFTLYAQWTRHEHTIVVDTEAVPATCTTPGSTESSHCSVCGEIVQKQEVIPALGHDWEGRYTVDKPASTEEPGWQSIHCKRCDETKDGKEIPRLDQTHTHTPVIVQAVPAACTTAGKTEGSYCSVCGEILQGLEDIPALGHDWDTEYTIDKPADTKSEGWKSIHCRRCDETKDGQEIPRIDENHVHTVIEDPEIPPTCTEDGKTGGSHCSVCGAVIQERQIIPALGHDWEEDYTVDIEPKADAEGQRSIHCRNCDARTDIQPIPALEDEKTDLSLFYIRINDGEEFVYDGQEKCPDITVENENTMLAPSDYQVEYSDNIHAGTGWITVTGRGDYTGTITETFEILKADNDISATARYTKTAKTTAQTFQLNVRAEGGSLSYRSNSTKVKAGQNGKVTIAKNFVGKAVVTVRAGSGDYEEVSAKITITVNPAGTTLSKVRNVSGKKMSLKWKKNSGVSGYQIQYAVNRRFSGAKSKTISGGSKTGITLKGLKKKKTYYVRIRTYKTVSGVRYYSSWTAVPKKVKISR